MRELSLNVMDIAQNSLSAGASLTQILVTENLDLDRLTIEIVDDGKGMTADQVAHVIDPFYTTRTTRKVGLGVPLFKMEAEMTGGSFSIDSTPGVGTRVTACFVPSSVDMIPLGDINSTVCLLIQCNPDRDFLFRRQLGGASFTLDTRELRQVLGEEVPLDAPDVTQWIGDYLSEQTQLLFGGATS
ncbi:MAG: sensor histidine kinase [Clostridiales bacterium]|jgi:anti-sigma regulatory factor (Ser/Thr protein kinase)|nr:sensor histidine kinase [Clostridiales bacterium]